MTVENAMSDWLVSTSFEDIPDDVVELMRTLIFVIAGCTVAGATGDGCEDVVDLVRNWGGAQEATILVHGGRVPAHNAVLANSVMARAYDICDFVPPGQHLGASVVPVALAAAELAGGCSGRDLLTALAVGCEVGSRLGRIKLPDGFDPTGVNTGFATAAITARLLGLDQVQMLHALGLAFNQAGGSFQSNIDGSLAVRMIQGFASQNGVMAAQLASRHITGPVNFITGAWGYYDLYGNDERDDEKLIGDLGARWDVRTMGFKKYPSCGGTLRATDAILALMNRHRVNVDEIDSIVIRMANKYSYTLVGHEFQLGDTPTVNAQFSVAYCLANAAVRGFPAIEHFAPEMVQDPAVLDLIGKISVVHDTDLAQGKHPARVQVELKTSTGLAYTETIDAMSGAPESPVSREQLLDDFWSRSAFGGKPVPPANLSALLETVQRLEYVDDARDIVGLLAGETATVLPVRG